jgi:hypothetical protein
MENRGSTEDNRDEKKAFAGAAPPTSALKEANIKQDDFAEEFSSDLPSMAVSSAFPDSPPFASMQSRSSASKFNYDGNGRNVSHRSVGHRKKLEHAPPIRPMPLPRPRMVDSLERPPFVLESNHDNAPGAFPVREPRNTAINRTFMSPIVSHDPPRQFTNEESKEEDNVPNSVGGHPGAYDSSHVATESGLYTVEAQRVPDGHEEATIMVAEAEYVRTKWYQRPVYRWILVGSILFACVSFGAVAVLVVLVIRPQSAASSSSLTSPTTVPITAAPNTPDRTTASRNPVPITGAPVSAPNSSPIASASPITAPITKAPATPHPTAAPPTPKPITAPPTRAPSTRRPATSSKPTSLTPDQIACNVLSIPNATKCRSTVKFDSTMTGSTIPSEIGLLTQLAWLDFSSNSLTSTIPSEIGLLTQLTVLSFRSNLLTSTIPSEIGLLTQLTYLDFESNSFTSKIPSEMRLLTQLKGLDFESNQLTSTIPSEIGLLTQLTYLDFSFNLLTSTIPNEIGLLSQLTMLYFDRNLLTSTIPSEIGLLTKLDWLRFSNNTLKGTMPSSLCSLPSLNGFINVDCGEISCDCCGC